MPLPSVMPEWSHIQGWLSSGEADGLFLEVMRTPEDAHIVEVGSFMGRSTYAMSLACRGTKRVIHAIDTFRGNAQEGNTFPSNIDYYPFFKKNLANEIATGIVVDHVMSSAGGWMLLKQLADFIFIDGSHIYEDVLFDIWAWWQRLKPHARMAIHDVEPNRPDIVCAVVDSEKSIPGMKRLGFYGSILTVEKT